MQRSHISIAVTALVVLVLFVLVPSVLLVVFAGLLFAAFLEGTGRKLAKPLHAPTGVGIAIVAVMMVIGFFALSGFAATAITGQFNELVSQIPQAVENVRNRLESIEWADRLIDSANPQGLISDGGASAATGAVTSTFGALGNLVLIVFIGIYFSINPGLYRRGFVALIAPSLRPRTNVVLGKCADVLKQWLTAQLIAMAVVGSLTGIGLWLIGMPLAIILGVIAGLLAFIPNIGPILAIIPALLLALGESMSMVVWVAGVYLSVQALESYWVTPMLQQERVHLPPAFLLTMQLLFAVLFGILGLALAMPMTAVAMTLINELYVKDYLEREPEPISGS